jgi:hypothetical protein
MLWLGVLLIVLWLVATATAHTFGGFIHILLIAAIIVLYLRIIRGA